MDEPVSPADHTADVPGPFQPVLFDTARALAESPSLAAAAPRMLESVCRALDWEFGALWEVDRARDVLRVVGMWQSPSAPLDEFAEASRAANFAKGIGLPGRVWAAGQPSWIPDVTRDQNFPRAAVATRCGLHAAFAIPVLQGTNVLGVLEFFSRAIVQPTPELVRLMTTVCSHIGLFLERRWANEELERFFTLSLDLFCVATFDGYFVRANPAWERVFGYTEAELCAAPFMSFVHPDDREATTAAMSDLSTGSHVIDFENRYRARDGSYKWLQWASAPLAEQGLVYAAARDVSDRKTAEEELRRYAADMERAKIQQEENAERLAQLVRELDIARQSAIRAAGAKSAVPGQHEPRDPHADERDHRHDRSRARHRAHAEQRDYLRYRPRVGRGAADDHQRHPRLLEDRGRQARRSIARRSSSATPWRTRSACSRLRAAREGPRAGLSRSRRTCPMPWSATPAACAR